LKKKTCKKNGLQNPSTKTLYFRWGRRAVKGRGGIQVGKNEMHRGGSKYDQLIVFNSKILKVHEWKVKKPDNLWLCGKNPAVEPDGGNTVNELSMSSFSGESPRKEQGVYQELGTQR